MTASSPKGSGSGARPKEDVTIEHREQPKILTGSAIMAALGVVFGDLGTSPLYTFQAITKAFGGKLDADGAIGSLSLIFWALIVTISIKYCLLVMRADNHGEGGILALLASAQLSWEGPRWPLVACGIFGAALIYGDGAITPAISVLSALEGVDAATDVFAPYIMPAAAVILGVLFAVQRFGTARVGSAFGPVMLLWFVTIGAIGAVAVVGQPKVLTAVNPALAVSLLLEHGWLSAALLGAVFLAVTGGEALSADMGHVGRIPIRVAWFAVVLPALLLSYAGQTALYLEHADVGRNPFFYGAPTWALYPLVLLATLATIIASQAIITGAFSLTRQAMQLGWLPGMRTLQTSAIGYGQIYIPFINWTMMALTIALTVTFASSERLAGAYGMAISATMLLTTILLYRVIRVRWRWKSWIAASLISAFLVADFTFFAANLLKITEGGWIPLLLGLLVMFVMTTWRAGLNAIHRAEVLRSEPIAEFRRELQSRRHKSPQTALFFTRLTHGVPRLIVDHVCQIGVMPKVMIALTVHFTDTPWLRGDKRVEITELCGSFWHVLVRYGFMETPNLPATLRAAQDAGCGIHFDDAVYFVERHRPVRRKRVPRMSQWRRRIFAFLLRNSVHVVDLFNLPTENFVEIGREIQI